MLPGVTRARESEMNVKILFTQPLPTSTARIDIWGCSRAAMTKGEMLPHSDDFLRDV